CAEIPFPVLQVFSMPARIADRNWCPSLPSILSRRLGPAYHAQPQCSPARVAGADCFFVRVHERAQSLLLCFITGRVQLLLRTSNSSNNVHARVNPPDTTVRPRRSQSTGPSILGPIPTIFEPSITIRTSWSI